MALSLDDLFSGTLASQHQAGMALIECWTATLCKWAVLFWRAWFRPRRPFRTTPA